MYACELVFCSVVITGEHARTYSKKSNKAAILSIVHLYSIVRLERLA